MRLHEHEDFAAFITAASRDSELPEPFVEKDYWITEILRTVAEKLSDRALFKGGTSLSKGGTSSTVSPRTSTSSSTQPSSQRWPTPARSTER